MNSYSLSLSTTASSGIQILPLLEMEDYSKLSLDMSQVYNKTIPIYVEIDWGDGKKEIFDNDTYGNRIYNELLFMNYNPCLTDIHTHEYYPSETCLYKLMTLQILVKYSNGDVTYFQMPIKIRTYDFFDSIGRLKLINVNILKNQLEYQFETSTGLIEMKTP